MNFKKFFAMSFHMLKCIKEEKTWWTFVGMYEGDNLAEIKIGNDTLVLNPSEKVSLPVVELRSGETVMLNHWNEKLNSWDKCHRIEKGRNGEFIDKGRIKECVSEIGTLFEYDPYFMA